VGTGGGNCGHDGWNGLLKIWSAYRRFRPLTSRQASPRDVTSGTAVPSQPIPRAQVDFSWVLGKRENSKMSNQNQNPGQQNQNPGQKPGQQQGGGQKPGQQQQHPGQQNPGQQNPGQKNPSQKNPGQKDPGQGQ